MSRQVVTVEVDGPRADLRLRRPEVLNAMSFEVFRSLDEAVEKVAASGAKVCVVSGEGRSFCSGIDVASLGSQPGTPEEAIAVAQGGFRKLAALEIPTIASVQGHALGAGLQLAIACDIRVVAEDASLGLLELNYGIIPDLGGSTGLPRLVGSGRAKMMIWTGARITGSEAGRIGLADVVVAPADLEKATSELAEALATAPSTPVKMTKRLVDAAHTMTTEEGFDAEAGAQVRCMTDPGFGQALADGISRVLSRRAAPPSSGGESGSSEV